MLESVLKRDRNIVAVALVLLTVLAWAYLLRLNATMSAPAMPTMPGMNMGPAAQPFAPMELAYAVVMWAMMMVGMMTPSAAPMILLYARVGRQARAQGAVFAADGLVCGGLPRYLERICRRRGARAGGANECHADHAGNGDRQQ